MESSSLEEENKIKDAKNKEIDDIAIKNIRNLFRLKKEILEIFLSMKKKKIIINQ